MNNYKKGKNVEETLQKNQIPIPNLPEDFLWMHVNPGTKMRNVLDFAMDEVNNKQRRVVVWSGSGPAVGKVISCAEIMKRQHPEPFHQVNKICYRKTKEYWDPVLEGLDPLVVVRELPTIHILLSKDPVDTTQLGYQAPLSKETKRKTVEQPYSKPPRRKIDIETFESFGLQSTRTRGRRGQRGGTYSSRGQRGGTYSSQGQRGGTNSPQYKGTAGQDERTTGSTETRVSQPREDRTQEHPSGSNEKTFPKSKEDKFQDTSRSNEKRFPKSKDKRYQENFAGSSETRFPKSKEKKFQDSSAGPSKAQ